jgi:hypothetical protein
VWGEGVLNAEMSVDSSICRVLRRQCVPVFAINTVLKHGSIITDIASCTREIKSSIAMAKAAFNKKKTFVTRKLDFNLRRKLVKCYIWSIALYGAETWTLRKVDRSIWNFLKCGAVEEWRRSAGPIV